MTVSLGLIQMAMEKNIQGQVDGYVHFAFDFLCRPNNLYTLDSWPWLVSGLA